MAGNEFSKEDRISYLSYRSRYILRGHISVDESAKPYISEIQRQPQSCFGVLDDLPLELLHAIFNLLDLQSLSRISRVSLRGRAIVKSLPAYRDLMAAAGYIFPTLSRTRLIGLHPAATLHAALRSDRCVSCGHYGAFLFLFSAERCCYACLSFNQSLWLVPLTLARDYFDLTRQQLKTLPTMRSIPGKYSVRRSISRSRPIRLISVRAAKELAIKVHGSAEAIARNLKTKRLNATTTWLRNAKWYQDAPLQPFSQDVLILKTMRSAPRDDYEGMGSIPFPSMSGNVVENGLWCRGCERTFEHYRFGKIKNDDVVSRLISPKGAAEINIQDLPYRAGETITHGLQYRARSEAEFLEHAHHCYSATEVITKRWVGLF